MPFLGTTRSGSARFPTRWRYQDCRQTTERVSALRGWSFSHLHLRRETAALFFWRTHRPASRFSNRRNADNTLARSKSTQRGLILMNGIFFARCQLSMLLADTERALASCLRFNSAGSFAAGPLADTVSPCAFELPLSWFIRARATHSGFLRNGMKSLRFARGY